MRGLFELRRLVDEMRERLPRIECPVCLIQSSDDPVVVPDSIETLREAITAASVSAHYVESDRHGIVHGDVGRTRELIREFLAGL